MDTLLSITQSHQSIAQKRDGKVRKPSNSTRGSSGQSIVEFALALPVILLILIGIMEFGRLLLFYSSVTSSSREGARYGSAAGDVGGFTPHYNDCSGIRAAAKKAAILVPVQDNQITISYDHGPSTGVFSTTCPPTQAVHLGDRIVVQVNTTFQPMLMFLNLPDIPVVSVTSRTILKDLEVEGTPPTPYPTNTATFVPGAPTNTPTNTSTPTPTPTNTSTPTQTPTPTLGPSSTPTATATASPSPTATNTATPLPTATATPHCELANGPISFGAQSISWTLTNLGTQDILLQTLSLDWPDNRPATKLNYVSFASKIWSGNADNSLSICDTCWNQGLTSDRLIAGGGTQTLNMSYSRSLYSGSYSFFATFINTVTGGTCSTGVQLEYVAP